MHSLGRDLGHSASAEVSVLCLASAPGARSKALHVVSILEELPTHLENS